MRIDIHSHLMNAAFLEHLRGRGALPTAVRDADGFITHCTPHFSVHYRPPILSVEAKPADMDAAGIDLAVLSPGPPSPAVLGGAQADSWAARINDELAVIAAGHPGRFAGWASLGFGDPSRAIAEVDRCLDQLGLAGFQVWSNIAGRPLDAPDVLPVLEHIAGRGAVIHLHPIWPAGQEPMSTALMLGFAFPADTSLAVLRLIGAGLFDRDPVIVAAHLGGVLPWLRERLAIHGRASAPFPGQPDLVRPMGEYLDRSTSTPSATGPRRWNTAMPSSAPTACCSAPTTPSPRPASPGSSSTACRAPRPNASRSWPATPSACYGWAPGWQDRPEMVTKHSPTPATYPIRAPSPAHRQAPPSPPAEPPPAQFQQAGGSFGLAILITAHSAAFGTAARHPVAGLPRLAPAHQTVVYGTASAFTLQHGRQAHRPSERSGGADCD